MHGDVRLEGPVFLFAEAVIAGVVLLSLFVLIDSFRSRRVASTARPDRLMAYRVVQGVWLLSLVLSWIPGAPAWVRGVPVFLILVAFVQGVAYLLRVVFPAPSAPTPEDAGDTEDADSEALV